MTFLEVKPVDENSLTFCKQLFDDIFFGGREKNLVCFPVGGWIRTDEQESVFLVDENKRQKNYKYVWCVLLFTAKCIL